MSVLRKVNKSVSMDKDAKYNKGTHSMIEGTRKEYFLIFPNDQLMKNPYKNIYRIFPHGPKLT